MQSQDIEDFLVQNTIHLSQKDNLNPDGTPNMEASKWGRFNQCYVSSPVATMTQNAIALELQGKIDPPKKWFMDERAYGVILNGAIIEKSKTGDINIKEGFNEEPSKVRFLWQRHADLMSLMIGDHTQGKYEYKFQSYLESRLVSSILTGYQTLFSVKIREIYGQGDGHIVSGCGIKTQNGKVQGIYVQDPAGSLFAPNSYRNNSFLGEKVYWTIEQLRRITKQGCHLMLLEAK